jgi:hypothetical protein
MAISNAFISAVAGSAWRSKSGAIYGKLPVDICDDVRRRYAAQYGNRPVLGIGGVGRKAFSAIVAAAIADDDAMQDAYAAFCADQAFNGR